jgi:hypothetical protein
LKLEHLITDEEALAKYADTKSDFAGAQDLFFPYVSNMFSSIKS